MNHAASPSPTESEVNRMRAYKTSVATLVAAAALAGCAMPTGPKVGQLPTLQDGAQLVVYRPKDKASLYFQGLLDGKPISDDVKNASLSLNNVTPGSHSFTIRLSSAFPSSSVYANSVSFNAENGRRVFVRVALDGGSETIRNIGGSMTVSGSYDYRIEVVPAAQAESEIAELRYVR